MMRALYSLLMIMLQPVLRSKLRRRARMEPEYGEQIEERFGFYSVAATAAATATALSSASGPQSQGFFVWVHAVSLGETRAAATLIDQLRQVLPGMRLLLTHGTATGRVQGRALLQYGDVQVWQPWDTPAAVQRFLAEFQPRIGLLVETEVWPNMVAHCAQRGVPLCLVNARMSEKSLKQSLRLGWLSRPAYAALRAVWAQASEDAARLVTLGAPVAGVLGNFKFDATPDAQQLQTGRAWHGARGRTVIVFANTREGEEAQFLQVLQSRKADRAIQWMLVPRHPQRFDEIAQLCQSHGFSVSRRSAWPSEGPSVGPSDADIWLGDSMGEMALYYALSDVALLGGSFAPLGGHNLIEAAACECPIVMGPHTFNFAQAAALALASGAAFAETDLAHAVETAVTLASAPANLLRAREAARDLGLAHRGAARRTAEAVRLLLDAKG